MKSVSKVFALVLMLVIMCMGSTVYAQDLDTIGSNGSSDGSGGTGDEAFDSVTDYMRNYNAMDGEDMDKASTMMSPITSIIGTIIGVIDVLTVALLFLVTALDLMYIAVPFVRKYLYPAGEMQQQGSPGMGGMGMGMGMGMRGGYGMGGMGGMGAQPAGDAGRKFVSDECIAALMESQPQQAAGGMGGMGMGMGMGMGGMGGMGAQAQPAPTKSVIATYLKKRIFFLIVFAIAFALLMSSIFFDCGLNLAQLLYKIFAMFSGSIANVDF